MSEVPQPDDELESSADAVVAARERIAALFGLSVDSGRFLEALTHPSFAHEVSGATDNQRLEFLGDAVLGLCVSDELIGRYPNAQEGQLTRTRAQVVSTEALSEFARERRIFEAIRFGRGAEQGNLHGSSKVLADAVEALIAASYLERGMDAARRICVEVLEAGLRAAGDGRDPKSELQERVQALRLAPPTYRVVERLGPAHETEFVVEVIVRGVVLGQGRGRSRRAAETAAARAALDDGSWRGLVPELSEQGIL
jgi:ribonuclease-3